MSEIASKGQLRLEFLRYAFVTVPLVLLLGFGSANLTATGSANSWYNALIKPDITPPDLAFPIAWTTLYIFQGLALAMILHARGARGRGLAIALFALQLLMCLAWTPLFFGAHQVSNALILIGVLAVTGLVTALLFGRIRTGAGLLMAPYVAWLAFATVLNWQVDRLNPDAETLVAPSSATQIDI